MITAMNRIYVVPEYAEQFEQRFRTRARLVDGMPGFIWNKVELNPTFAYPDRAVPVDALVVRRT